MRFVVGRIDAEVGELCLPQHHRSASGSGDDLLRVDDLRQPDDFAVTEAAKLAL